MPAPRAVLDTNVFVSALLGKGPSARLYEALKEGRFWLVLSNALIAEIAEALLRPKLSIPPSDIKAVFKLFRKRTLIVRPKEPVRICRDPEDNFILECALAGQVAWIVTGDKDLLALHPFRGIHIVPPSTFFKHLSP